MLFNRRAREVTVEEIALEFVLLEHVRVDDDDETTLTKDIVVDDDCDTVSVPVPAPDGATADDCDWTVMVLQTKSISAYPQNIVSLSRNQIISETLSFRKKKIFLLFEPDRLLS